MLHLQTVGIDDYDIIGTLPGFEAESNRLAKGKLVSLFPVPLFDFWDCSSFTFVKFHQMTPVSPSLSFLTLFFFILFCGSLEVGS